MLSQARPDCIPILPVPYECAIASAYDICQIVMTINIDQRIKIKSHTFVLFPSIFL